MNLGWWIDHRALGRRSAVSQALLGSEAVFFEERTLQTCPVHHLWLTGHGHRERRPGEVLAADAKGGGDATGGHHAGVQRDESVGEAKGGARVMGMEAGSLPHFGSSHGGGSSLAVVALEAVLG